MAKRVLIVDDEQFFIEPIKFHLEHAEYEVSTANDGLSGLEKARAETPDLIILDIMLPGINGYFISRLLKFDGKYKHIPVIIVSAKDTEEDKRLGSECGADLYMPKPIDPSNLLQQIERLT